MKDTNTRASDFIQLSLIKYSIWWKKKFLPASFPTSDSCLFLQGGPDCWVICVVQGEGLTHFCSFDWGHQRSYSWQWQFGVIICLIFFFLPSTSYTWRLLTFRDSETGRVHPSSKNENLHILAFLASLARQDICWWTGLWESTQPYQTEWEAKDRSGHCTDPFSVGSGARWLQGHHVLGAEMTVP